ncbi:hypothetical protein RRSWK_03187 [Rhodopirellula sp. SWK7]|nr:hypothetical protein RRSWK_03187 [Rhodopirellula sp. SWK7]
MTIHEAISWILVEFDPKKRRPEDLLCPLTGLRCVDAATGYSILDS